MIAVHTTSLIEYKTLRTEPSVRVLFDLGEISPATVAALHEFRVNQNSNLMILSDAEYVKVMKMIGGEVPAEVAQRVSLGSTLKAGEKESSSFEPEPEHSPDFEHAEAH